MRALFWTRIAALFLVTAASGWRGSACLLRKKLVDRRVAKLDDGHTNKPELGLGTTQSVVHQNFLPKVRMIVRFLAFVESWISGYRLTARDTPLTRGRALFSGKLNEVVMR